MWVKVLALEAVYFGVGFFLWRGNALKWDGIFQLPSVVLTAPLGLLFFGLIAIFLSSKFLLGLPVARYSLGVIIPVVLTIVSWAALLAFCANIYGT